MTTANKLTILRVLLVPIFMVFMLARSLPNSMLYSLIVFAVASVTDHYDGKIARKYNQITDFGKFLDPLADKVLVMAAFTCFVEVGLIGSVPVIIMFTREFLVTSVRLIAVGSGEVIAANSWGKAKTVSQILAIILILMLQYLVQSGLMPLSGFSVKIGLVNNLATWICVVLTVISGAIYIKDNMRFIKAVQ